MARSQNIVGRLPPSASMASAGGQAEPETPMVNDVDNRRPHFFGSALQSQTVRPRQASGRVCQSCMVDEEEEEWEEEEEEEDVIQLDEVGSDPDFGLGGTPTEEEENFLIEDDEGADFDATASTSVGQSNFFWSSSALNNPSGAIPMEDEEEEEEEFWIDEGTDGAVEGQHQNFLGGFWSSSALNNPSGAIPLVDEEDDDDDILIEDDEDIFVEDDEGADTVAEGQHQNHHATASSLAEESNSDVGLFRSKALNNPRGAIPVVLTDPDVLDCPICYEPFCSPIYQCENGHAACSPCCTKSNHKCPSCCLPIGFNRCRAMEKLIESITVDCENKPYGCRETLIYSMKSKHEQLCTHTLCFCPISSCDLANSSKNIYDHFSNDHPSSATSFTFDIIFNLSVRRGQKHAILQERNEGVIFILNHEIHEHGRVFNVDCLGPNSFRAGFVYQLRVKCLETCFSIESVPEVCGKWEEHTPKKNYLTIPSEYSRFSIEVCIKKASQVA